jgi:vacuolar-type H+-ATPase subunit F/Vma7
VRLEIAAVGRDDFVQGFKLVGVRKAISATKEDLEKKIGIVLDDADVGILVLNTADMKTLSNSMRRRLETVARPVVIGVGATEDEDLRTKVKRAIGVDLFK